jgi:hypothetical protein
MMPYNTLHVMRCLRDWNHCTCARRLCEGPVLCLRAPCVQHPNIVATYAYDLQALHTSNRNKSMSTSSSAGATSPGSQRLGGGCDGHLTGVALEVSLEVCYIEHHL